MATVEHFWGVSLSAGVHRSFGHVLLTYLWLTRATFLVWATVGVPVLAALRWLILNVFSLLAERLSWLWLEFKGINCFLYWFFIFIVWFVFILFGNSTVQYGCTVIIVWFYCLCSILKVIGAHCCVLRGEWRRNQRLRVSDLAISWYIILFVVFIFVFLSESIGCLEGLLSSIVAQRTCGTSSGSLFTNALHLLHFFTNSEGFGCHLGPPWNWIYLAWACVKVFLLQVNHISRIKGDANYVGLRVSA